MFGSKLKIDGCDVGVSDSGGDLLPVFLFHGNSSSRDVYSELMLLNNGTYRLISVDLPGHGDTVLPDWSLNGISIRRIGEFAHSVIRYYGFNEYVVVGQSIGGHALMENEAIMSESIGLCLLSSPPINSNTIADAFLDSPVMPLLFQGELDATELSALGRQFVYDHRSRLIPRVTGDIERTDPRFRPLLGLGMEVDGIMDEYRALADYRNEVLMIRGSHDAFLNPKFYNSLQGLPLWGGSLLEFECGHCISLERPQLLWEALSKYIDSVCPSI